MKCKKCEAELPAGSSYCCFCGVRQFAKKATRTRGNGTGSVYKRGKTWTAAISVGHYANGSCCRKTKGGFKTKNEAVLYLDKLRADPFATKQEIRICQLYDAIQPHLDKLSDNKRSHYRTAYARLEKHLARQHFRAEHTGSAARHGRRCFHVLPRKRHS